MFLRTGVLAVIVIMYSCSSLQTERQENNNPVLKGYYADPEILYSNKTGKYYLYPTTDGFDEWTGHYFKTFSSQNLVDWKDEGVILNFKTDVSWADKHAWAPSIIEKEMKDGTFKYYYYYSADKKIGVAIADHPTGPFMDSGKPLIDHRHDLIKRKGQVIDPDVFRDPKTGKYYLYWGNGFMAGAELNDDMVSIKEETIKEMTPSKNYTEGTYIFYRKGKYYFTWSHHDTRDPDYRVRYGYLTESLGDLTVPEDNLVITRKDEDEIFATGHHAVLNIPDTDDWYIVYHRFHYPKGIIMGRAAGYHREVCIDKLEFNENGSIKRVIPTHSGILPVN